MTSHGKDASRDCHIKSNLFPDLRIELDTTYNFPNPIVIDRNPQFRSVYNKTFSFLMKGANGDLTVRENCDGDKYQAYARLGRDSFTIVQYNNLNADGMASGTYTIHLMLKTGYSLQYGTDGSAKPTAKKQGNINFNGVVQANTVLGRESTHLPQVRHVRIVIPGYKNVHLTTAFNEVTARQILNQEILTDFRLIPEKFVNLNRRALHSESELTQQVHKRLVRENVSVRFEQLPGFGNRFYVVLNQQASDPQWLLHGQERIILRHTAAAGNTPGIFGQTPTPTPGMKGNLWRGTVFFKNGIPCAAINNVINAELANIMRSTKVVNGITITFEEEDDPNTTRALTALTHLLNVMNKHVDPQFQANTDQNLFYNVPPTGVFMSKRRELMKRNVPAFGVNAPDGQVAPLLNDPVYQFTAASKIAVQNAFTSEYGISIIQGPPATGKTECVSKLIGWTLRHSKIAEDESIVLSAHTNVAVAVACQRFLKHNKSIFIFNPNSICLVWSENKAEYGRLVQKELPEEIAQITLDAHCDRLAATNTERFRHYLIGRDEIRKNGRIEDKGVRARYVSSMKELVAVVKKGIRVWFATLASFHDTSPAFGNEKGWTGINCALLIYDEASQAHILAAWLAWRILNPQRIVLAGDHNQLAPFVVTTEAEWVWKESLFEQLRNDTTINVPHVMLDIQYRTTENIYAGTNVLYERRVQSHSSTRNRPLHDNLMKALPRIRFVDADNNKFKILSNTHWFDIQNGQTISKGQTSSSTNPLELNFIMGFFGALIKCGAPAKDCMLLTGYQAMFDDLLEAEKTFLNEGTQVKKVDGAQGDEAAIVGMTLVRNSASGLGFMAQLRRQNVMTSRARDALYGVGEVSAMYSARAQGNPAWANWFEGISARNGEGFRIRFRGPVRFYVDGTLLDLQPRRPGPDSAVLPSTLTGAEMAVQQDPVTARRDSTPSRPSTPLQRLGGSRPGTPSPSSPQFHSAQPSPQQSPSPTPGGRTQMVGSIPMRFMTSSPPQPVSGDSSASFGAEATSSRAARQSSGSYPRRSSLLNPEHGRSAGSGDLGYLPQGHSQLGGSPRGGPAQSFPLQSDLPEFYTNEFIRNTTNRIDSRDAVFLRDAISGFMSQHKSNYQNQWNNFKRFTNDLYTAKLDSNPVKYNDVIVNIRGSGAGDTAINDMCVLAHAMTRLWFLDKAVVPWP